MAIQNNNPSYNVLNQAKTMLPMASTENMSGMRMAAPVVQSFKDLKMAKDVFQGSNQIATASASSIGGTVKGAFGGLFRNLPGLIKSNFVVSAILSGVSNLYEMATGKVKPLQAAGNFVADTAAYTGIGVAATSVGAMIGSLIPIPVVGTLLGAGVGALGGLLLGKFYEEKIRDKFSGTVQQSIQSVMSSAQQATQAPAQS
ncbi:hypothetical protein D3C87_890470 [compost metagenome]